MPATAAITTFHAELREVLGGRAPNVSDLPRLKYTEMIAKEAMRLYPPAYAVGREAIEDTEIGGYRVPKGTRTVVLPSDPSHESS